MKILKTLIGDDSGNLSSCDTIEYKNGLWLVPEWFETPVLGYKIPAIIIRFDQLEYQTPGAYGFDFQLRHGVPKAVLCGEIKGAYEVINAPDIRFPIPKGIH